MTPRAISIEPLSQHAFAAFGDVIESDARASFWINEDMAERFHALSEIKAMGEGARAVISLVHSQKFTMPRTLEHLEKHPLGSQAFIPLEAVPFILVVAFGDEIPQINTLRAFVTNGSQGINYHPGTWHHVLLTAYAPLRFICIDRAGPGNNCIDYFFAESEQKCTLGLPA